MASKLPQVGVEAVVLNSDRYFSILEKIEQSTSRTADSLTKQAEKTVKVAEANDKATKSFNPLSKILTSLDNQFGGFGQKILSVTQNLGGAEQGVAGLASEMTTGAGAIALATAAATAAITAFIALGQRGAGLVGLAESFDRLNQAIGVDAVQSLEKLRVASAGTVSDFELIRLANVALAGSAGEFGQQFGENLPRLLEIARVQARATGQDVGFLFQSLITGIKRGSPLLIDNTGLVLKISEANAAMAASLGKSVEQLTAEEKQIAVLNATLAAGQTAIDAFAGVQETAADKLARMNATITNILDTLAVGVQPAFGQFLDVGNRFLAMIQSAVTAITPLLSSLLDLGATILLHPVKAFLAVAEVVQRFTNFLWTLVTVIVQPVINAIKTLFNFISIGVGEIIKFLGEWVNQNLGLNFDNLALNLGRGAGYVFGAFAEGIMQAANNVILPAVLWIATAIADFLVGQSPPPKGPLSQIDKGGANTMMAWLDGFAGVSLEPVDQVAASVNATLGNIGAFSMPMVEARIATLDQALQPFNDQLEITKANFDAIATPAKAALDAIERQTAKAQEALAAGDVGAAERIRQLDKQREMIEKEVDAQQQLVDSASIQQALAKSQQAPERALLAIQQTRLKALETKKTPEAKAAAEAAGKGGAPTPEAVAGAGGGAGFDMGLPSVADLVSGQSAVDEMGADLGQGFTEGLAVSMNAGTVDTFNGLVSQIGAQTQRIGQANIGQRIADAFGSLGTLIQTKLDEASVVITDWIGGITDPAREGSIPYTFNALTNGDYSGLVSSLSAPFENFADNVALDVQNVLSYINDPANQESITAGLQAFTDNLPAFLQPMFQVFTDHWASISADIQTWLDNTFNPDNINSIPGQAALLPTRLGNALRDVGDTFTDNVVTPIADKVTEIGTNLYNFFAGTGEGTLSGYIDAGVAWFTALPQRIFDALASIGGVFYAVMVAPLIGGVNLAIAAIEGLINNTLSALGTAIGSLQSVAEAVGLGDQVAEIASGLAAGITLPRISLPNPPAPQMPAAKRGGIFTGGMMRTSELGSELMMNAASKTAVFPAGLTRDIDLIARILGGGGSMPLPLLAGNGGNNSSVINNTNNFNMAQPASSGNSVQQIATLLAMKRR